MEHPERLIEIAILRRNMHARRLGPRVRIRLPRRQIARHLALLKMPDPDPLGLDLQRHNLIPIIVKRLPERAVVSVEAAPLATRAVEHPVAIIRLLLCQMAALYIDRALLRGVEGVAVCALQVDVLEDINLRVGGRGLALVDPEGGPHAAAGDGDVREVADEEPVVEVAPGLEAQGLAAG